MKRRLLVLSLMVFSTFSLLAQRTITGKVKDDKSEPLIGASILVKGTNTGTVTDLDGGFQVQVQGGTATLIVSYTGYATK